MIIPAPWAASAQQAVLLECSQPCTSPVETGKGLLRRGKPSLSGRCVEKALRLPPLTFVDS